MPQPLSSLDIAPSDSFPFGWQKIQQERSEYNREDALYEVVDTY
jgi:hypothetical protein